MKGFKAVKAMKREDVMINTVGLLLCPGTEFELSSKASVGDIIGNWKYLRKQKKYFPAIELLPDEKLKIEFCPAKVKYEQNLYEIAPNDILQILVLLNTLLEKAHVNTCPAILFYAHVYRIDYSKVCYMPFSSQTLWSCLQDIHKGGHYKQAFTFYIDGGHMSASALKLRKVAFYNKSSEILQDKRNTNELTDLIKRLPGTFYRLECSLKTAKEIRRELSTCSILVKSCRLKELSSIVVVRTVLQENLRSSFRLTR